MVVQCPCEWLYEQGTQARDHDPPNALASSRNELSCPAAQ